MSLPPTKRSLSSNAAASPSSSSSSSRFQPPMKKARSQAVACSLDPNKNCLHNHHNNQGDNDVVLDHSSMALDYDSKSDDARAPAAAILSRKKAIPLQPAKKLVIKLVKACTAAS
ncbi:cullin-4-like [Hibiscus syriacus]|uniref:cullin-4-like n=1 Tax=Hibiscus syriacus TaxID=106335 RepID=UPI001923C94A|nr:cullin-4-like [Hibiscus syriacus]